MRLRSCLPRFCRVLQAVLSTSIAHRDGCFAKILTCIDSACALDDTTCADCPPLVRMSYALLNIRNMRSYLLTAFPLGCEKDIFVAHAGQTLEGTSEMPCVFTSQLALPVTVGKLFNELLRFAATDSTELRQQRKAQAEKRKGDKALARERRLEGNSVLQYFPGTCRRPPRGLGIHCTADFH